MARVLLVDDDPFFLKLAGDILRDGGFTVETAGNGREAMRILASSPCEVVVTDIVMPDLSGLELLRMIKRLEPLKPVICVSSYQSFPNAVEMLRGGAFDFVPKPVEAGHLVAAVRAAEEAYAKALEREKLVARAQGWTRELLTLRSLGEAAGEDVLRTLFRRTVEAVADTLGVQVVSLMLMGDRELTIADANGLPADVIPKVRVPLGKGISGWVAQHGEPLLINDIATHPVFRPSTFSQQYQNQSALCVPIKRGDRILGVINVNNKVDGTAFEQKDLDLLTTVANQVSLAIDNARLFRDLEEKAAELARAHQELVALDKDKTELILNISHELKTPLTAIFGYAGLLHTLEGGAEKADITEYTGHIESSAHRLNHIVERMLELFRLEAGRTRATPVWTAVGELTAAAAEQAHQALSGRALQSDLSAAPPRIHADPVLLRKALALALENAGKFSPPGSPVSLAVWRLERPPAIPAYALPEGREPAPAPGWVELTVADAGPGMREADIPIIFEKFKQLGNIMTEKPTGTGLGLSIARAAMELHHGYIWAESERGKGSIFHLLLPQPEDKT